MSAIVPSAAFVGFANTPAEWRRPVFINECQTEEGRIIADKAGPKLFELLRSVYPFRPVEAISLTHNGDCFHATVSLMLAVVQNFNKGDFQMMTGTFQNPKAHEVIYHCWFRFNGIVYNVSNIPLKPMYSVEYDFYRRHNHLSRVIQTVTRDDVYAYFRKLKKGGLKNGDTLKVHEAVQFLLSKTLKEQKNYFQAIGKV